MLMFEAIQVEGLQRPLAPYVFDLIFSKVSIGDGCWEWTGCKNANGYGSFTSVGCPDKRGWLAHRLVYVLLVGDIPDGLGLDHLCRNRACVRPSHLEPVTQWVNTMRGTGASARNIIKTHCIRGHAFDETNTYIRRDGRRLCRACENERMKQRLRRLRETTPAPKRRLVGFAAANANKTHCVHGHPFDETNTIVTPTRRACRICRIENNRRGDLKRRLRRMETRYA